jgi:SAM-dependent methyltransferase
LVAQPVLWAELILAWELSPEWVRYFDAREGNRCGFCSSSLRDRQLAAAIIKASEVEAGSLRDVCKTKAFRSLKVAEINAAGALHEIIKGLPNLLYSEFGSVIPAIPSEDLLALSYSDNTFDLLITAETLEHVPDVQAALRETYRVLKPGGVHVFSTPVVWDQKHTRQRAVLQDGKLIHQLPPSFHGNGKTKASDMLVFYEFGADLVDFCRSAGFEVDLLKDAENPALVTFLARKPS